MNLFRFLFLGTIACCLSTVGKAQIRVGATAIRMSGTIKGKVTDQASGKPVQGVSVLAKTKDSTMLGYTFTNENGEYSLTKIPLGQDFRVFVSLFGYKEEISTVQKFKIPGSILFVQDWNLAADKNTLKEVTVNARRPPFVIKKDTLEFDATAFKLLPHAILEDLLKRLPGVLMDKEGNITVNGKKATKIQVDGKDFFGGNTSIAVQNLPAGIVEKVQITPSDNPERKINRLRKPAEGEVTINLLLKKDQNKGILGNIRAGYGTENRYEGNAMFASFGGKLRYGLFSSAGNGSASTVQGNGGMTTAGGTRMPLGGTLSGAGGSLAQTLASGRIPNLNAGGISDRKNLSTTFNSEAGKTVKIDGNYSYNDQQTLIEKKSERFNIQDSGGLLYAENQSGNNNNITHSFSTNIILSPDTLTNWRFTPTVSYSIQKQDHNTSALSADINGNDINASVMDNLSESRRNNFGHTLFFGRRSKDGKTGWILNWNINGSQSKDQLFNQSTNEFFDPSKQLQQIKLNQKGTSNENSLRNDLSFQVSRNLSRSFTGSIEYRLNQQFTHLKKGIFNLNTATGQYDLTDSLQSGNNKSNNIQHNVSLQLAYRKGKLDIALNAGMRFINQNNRLSLQDTTINIAQRQFAPKLIFNYSLPNNGNLNLAYDIASFIPSADQLSAQADLSNPLLVVKGNPFLKTAIGHNISLGFNKFLTEQEMNFNASLNGSFIKNQIVQDIDYDNQGRQIQTFRNVDGYRSLRFAGGLQKGFHIQELSIRPFFNFSFNNKQDVGFINSKRNQTHQWQYGTNSGLALNYGDLIFFSSNVNLSFNKTEYSLDERDDQDYHTMDYSTSLKISPTGRVELGSQLSYQFNSQIPEQFQRDAIVLSSSLTYRFLKKEQLSFTFLVNDIFNQAIVNSTIITPSFRENSSVNSLRRYFLFSLQYNFNHLSGTKK